jgi:hypothetical protein
MGSWNTVNAASSSEDQQDRGSAGVCHAAQLDGDVDVSMGKGKHCFESRTLKSPDLNLKGKEGDDGASKLVAARWATWVPPVDALRRVLLQDL